MESFCVLYHFCHNVLGCMGQLKQFISLHNLWQCDFVWHYYASYLWTKWIFSWRWRTEVAIFFVAVCKFGFMYGDYHNINNSIRIRKPNNSLLSDEPFYSCVYWTCLCGWRCMCVDYDINQRTTTPDQSRVLKIDFYSIHMRNSNACIGIYVCWDYAIVHKLWLYSS